MDRIFCLILMDYTARGDISILMKGIGYSRRSKTQWLYSPQDIDITDVCRFLEMILYFSQRPFPWVFRRDRKDRVWNSVL